MVSGAGAAAKPKSSKVGGETRSSGPSPSDPGVRSELVSFTIRTDTGELIKIEKIDETGARHELDDEAKAIIAKGIDADPVEELIALAFEDGIACVLGDESRNDDKEEYQEDGELRHLLLHRLMKSSLSDRLTQPDMLNRTILLTLIQRSHAVSLQVNEPSPVSDHGEAPSNTPEPPEQPSGSA
ncbi:MAG TPA: hypothetical protein VGH36_08320 [Acetobacteraceae bacterium]|jgi:hypothetical protein